MITAKQIATAIVNRLDGRKIVMDDAEWATDDVGANGDTELLLENDEGTQVTVRLSVEVLP